MGRAYPASDSPDMGLWLGSVEPVQRQERRAEQHVQVEHRPRDAADTWRQREDAYDSYVSALTDRSRWAGGSNRLKHGVLVRQQQIEQSCQHEHASYQSQLKRDFKAGKLRERLAQQRSKQSAHIAQLYRAVQWSPHPLFKEEESLHEDRLGLLQNEQRQRQALRANAMWEVFNYFDFDGSKTIDSDELMELGHARRALGQVKGVWDDESNRSLLALLGADSQGRVTGASFVKFFISELEGVTDTEFEVSVKEFREAARACRVKRSQGAAGRHAGWRDHSAARQQSRRSATLRAVFHQFDLDGNGRLDARELMQIGQQRHGPTVWTQRTNEEMLRQLRADEAGRVEESAFIESFERDSMDLDEAEFEEWVGQLRQAAHECRQRPQQQPTALESQAEAWRRREALWEVFELFDLDYSGFIEGDELMELGRKRRQLGYVDGQWGRRDNEALLTDLGCNEQGNVDSENFVDYFIDQLAELSDPDFDGQVREFRACARVCRNRREVSMAQVCSK